MIRTIILLFFLTISLHSFAQEQPKLPKGWDEVLLEGKTAYMNLITGEVTTEFPKKPAVKPVEVPEYDPTIIHVVQKGETLSTIARKYQISLAKLYQLNSMVDFDKIAIGEEVVVGYKENPENTTISNSKAIKNSNAKIHVVSVGETLFRIATKYKISVSQLKERNKLSDNTIVVGQKLIIE